jgi:phosphoribosylformimino-5-aminoimidazole carboxamide ribotide isomerase
MEIIPVLDVKSGLVVVARGGKRANYLPIFQARDQSDPHFIISKYLSLYSFRTFYIADLDGIEGRGPNLKLVEDCASRYPNLAFWIDNGSRGSDELSKLMSLGRSVMPVVGTESSVSPDELRSITDTLNGGFVLSLDYRGEDFLGNPSILDAPNTWPAKIIVMTLSHVGMNLGPDLERITRITEMAPSRSIYSAGGIRSIDDLKSVRRAGCAGALMATALHSGQIKTGDLEEAAGF